MVDNEGTVVALLSGGKDSLFALHCCIHFGYKLEVVGHIRSSEVTEEADSYMYQTVGSQMIEAIGSCLDVPVVTHTLSGCPKAVTGLDYEETEGDEVEDLYKLLNHIKTLYPTVKYVSTGAILSDYQRCRVEHVCHRLGLISLAFLWKFQQSVLLKLMATQPDFEALIIKVACMGLSTVDLGQSILRLAPKFLRMEQEFGFNCCGEGGEYETTTVNSPLFKRTRIAIPAWETKVHSDDAFAPVVFLYPSQAVSTVPKDDQRHTFSADPVAHTTTELPFLRCVSSGNRYYFLDVLGTDDVRSFIASTRAFKPCFRMVHDKSLNDWSTHHLTMHDIQLSFHTSFESASQQRVFLTQPASLMASPWHINRSTLTPITAEARYTIRHNKGEAYFTVTPHPCSLSRSLWRTPSITGKPYPDSFTINNSILMTNWITGRVPHTAALPSPVGTEHPFWTEFVLALRDLRNLLLDRASGLHLVYLVDVLVDESCKIPSEFIAQVLTGVWHSNFVCSLPGSIPTLIRAREASIWDLTVFQSASTPEHSLMSSPRLCDPRSCASLPSRYQDKPPVLRIWDTHSPFGGHVAVKVIAGVAS